jgi:hypothetical protein
METDLFAGTPIRDFRASVLWYERLFGTGPAFLPHDREAVWELAPHRFLYIIEDPARAGNALHTIFVDDLPAVLADTASRGLRPAHVLSGVREFARRVGAAWPDRVRPRRPADRQVSGSLRAR